VPIGPFRAEKVTEDNLLIVHNVAFAYADEAVGRVGTAHYSAIFRLDFDQEENLVKAVLIHYEEHDRDYYGDLPVS